MRKKEEGGRGNDLGGMKNKEEGGRMNKDLGRKINLGILQS